MAVPIRVQVFYMTPSGQRIGPQTQIVISSSLFNGNSSGSRPPISGMNKAIRLSDMVSDANRLCCNRGHQLSTQERILSQSAQGSWITAQYLNRGRQQYVDTINWYQGLRDFQVMLEVDMALLSRDYCGGVGMTECELYLLPLGRA